MSPLASGLRDSLSSWRRTRWSRRFTGNRWGLNARIGPKGGDRLQQLDAMPKRRDAKLLQVLVR
jgi:hypothetical protein